MKTYYVNEYLAVIYSEDASLLPRIGDSVVLNEDTYYVKSVSLQPQTKEVFIHLQDELAKKRITESKEDNIQLKKIHEIEEKASKALKETSDLKRQLFSIRQYLRAKAGHEGR